MAPFTKCGTTKW